LRKTVMSVLAAAGEGAISAGQLGSDRQCSVAVTGTSRTETGFKGNDVELTGRRNQELVRKK